MDHNAEETRRNLIQSEQELARVMGGSSKQFNEIGSQFGSLKEQQEAELKARQLQAQAMENFANRTRNYIDEFTSNASGSFKPLKTAVSLITKGLSSLAEMIPRFGGAISGVIKVAGEAANFMIDRFEKAYGEFEKISDTGVVSSFEDLQVTSQATRLGYAQVTKVLTEASKDLALIGGSAANGRKVFEQMAISTVDARAEFQKLGISSEEFSQYQISYLQQDRKSNVGRKKDIDTLTAESLEYIDQLDLVAKVTGASRKTIDDARKQRMESDVRFRATLQDMTKEQQDAFQSARDFLEGEGAATYSQALSDMVAGAFQTPAVKSINATSTEVAKAMQELAAQIQAGTISQKDIPAVMNKLRAAAADAEKANAETAKLYGNSVPQTANYVETSNLANKKGQDAVKTAEEVKKEQERLKKETGTQNSQLATTKQHLEQASINLDQLATSSEFITGAMDLMSSALDDFTEFLYKQSGQKLPEGLKARIEETEAIRNEIKIRKDYNEVQDKLKAEEKDTGVGAYLQRNLRESALAGLEQKWIEAEKKRQLATKNFKEATSTAEGAQYARKGPDKRVEGLSPPGSAPASSGGTSGGDKELPKGKDSPSSDVAGDVDTTGMKSDKDNPLKTNDYEGLKFKNPKEDVGGGPAYKKTVAAAKNFQQKYPDSLITAFNDNFHQAYKPPKNADGSPKPSHQTGEAMDISGGSLGKANGNVKKGQEIIAELRAAGFDGYIQDEYNDLSKHGTGGHFHAEIKTPEGSEKPKSARTGGMFTAPPGRQARTGGEFIGAADADTVDAGGDSSDPGKQALNTTNLTSSSQAESAKMMTMMYDQMSSKMDSLVDLLKAAARGQEKQLMSKMS